jgi:hypothetical protein
MIHARFSTLNLSLLGMGVLAASLIWPISNYNGGRAGFIIAYAVGLTFYGFACWLVWRNPNPTRRALNVILLFAIAFRIALLVTDPVLSDDIYRYVWDGKMQAHGINPYRYIPADETLARFRDADIYPRINRKDYAQTIYPPAAQAVFFGSYALFGNSVRGVKVILIALDGLTIIILIFILGRLSLDPNRVILYAWHPLPLWEFAHSGHIDAAAIAFIAMAWLCCLRKRPALTGVFLALAGLVKFYPFVLLPAFYRKWDWKLPAALIATIVLAYVPYSSVGLGMIGSLPIYLQEEQFVSGRRIFPLEILRLIVAMPTEVYLTLAAILLGLLSWKVLHRDGVEQHANGSLLLIGALMLLSTPHYSWYFLWLLPFLCVRFSVAWFYLVSVAVLLYFVRDRSKSEVIFVCLQNIPVYGLLIWSMKYRPPMDANQRES